MVAVWTGVKKKTNMSDYHGIKQLIAEYLSYLLIILKILLNDTDMLLCM